MTRLDAWIYAAAFTAAFVAHAFVLEGLGSAARRAHRRKKYRTVALDVVKSEPPTPSAEPPNPDPPKPKPKPKPKLRPKPIDLTRRPLPPPEQPPPPPPPNTDQGDEPAEEAKPVFGISMTSVAGPGSGASFSVRVGNTTMKDPEDEITPPEEVKPYKPVPIYDVQRMPKPVGSCTADYPDEAKQLGIEGKVKLEVDICIDGSVCGVRVVSGLGYGLDETAVAAMKRCRFEPALFAGKPVATRIIYTFTFLLED